MAAAQEELDYGFPPARGGRGAPSMFPRKLFQILCETDPKVVGWDSDGKSFHVSNLDEFVEGVMPLFYRHNKLTSFQRQLNLYGFKKRGKDEACPGHYYHPSFQRDHPDLLGDVRRSYPSSSAPSIRSEEDDEGEGDHPRSSTDNVESAAAHEPSSPRRRKRVALSKRKAGGMRLLPMSHKTSPAPPERPASSPSPQRQYQQHRTRAAVDSDGGGPSYSVSSKRDANFGSAPRRFHREDEEQDEVQEEEEEAEEEDYDMYPRSTNKRPQRPWFYSGSSAVSHAAVAARRRQSEEQYHRPSGMKETGREDGRGGGGGGGSGNGSRGGSRGRGERASETFVRRPYPYSTGRGNSWGPYREQEGESLPGGGGGAGGGRWYDDSEESGLSRLTSCDSACSAWEDMQQGGGGGGGEHFDRSRGPVARERAMGNASSLMGPGGRRGDSRRYHSRLPQGEEEGRGGAPNGGGGGGGGMRPVHRSVPTSSMFPADYLRRVSSFHVDAHYPPPPKFLPAHTQSSGGGGGGGPPPPQPSRWRPVYNDDDRVGARSSGNRGVGNGNGWGGPSRVPGGRTAEEWGGRYAGNAGEAAAMAAEAAAVAGMVGGGGKARKVAAATRPAAAADAAAGGGMSGHRSARRTVSRTASAMREEMEEEEEEEGRRAAMSLSSYKASRGEFLSEEDDGVAGEPEDERPGGVRYRMGGAGAVNGNGGVGSRARARPLAMM